MCVCVCVCVGEREEGVCLVSLLWLQSVYRLQVMPGLDKRSPIPPRCLDQGACDSTRGTGRSAIYSRFLPPR